MENYNSIEVTKQLVKDGKISQEIAETIFPQLKESEDERIRKEIISYIKSSGAVTNPIWIAWLEKQGKQNPKSADFIPTDCTSDAKNENRWHKVEDSLPDDAREVLCKDTIGNFFIGRYYNDGDYWEVSMYDEPDKSNKDNPPVIMWMNIPSYEQVLANSAKTCKVEPKFKVGDKIKLAKEPKYPAREIIAIQDDAYYFDGLVHLPFINQDMWELVGQNLADERNPAWSEEDEKMYTATIFALAGFMGNGDKLEWLKSLKDRYTWKPSEQQMECLLNIEGVLRAESRIAMAQKLSSLYNDLKKLKG